MPPVGISIFFFLALVLATEALAEIAPPRLTGRLDSYGVVRLDHSSPSQAPQARLDLALEQSLGRNWRWHASLIGRWGGPPKNADPGIFWLNRTFQNESPSLEVGETYFDYRGDRVDVRLGFQKFFWGQLDSIQPNDLLSPREYEDPFLTDAADAKIAVPAATLTYYPRAPSAVSKWLVARLTIRWAPSASARSTCGPGGGKAR